VLVSRGIRDKGVRRLVLRNRAIEGTENRISIAAEVLETTISGEREEVKHVRTCYKKENKPGT